MASSRFFTARLHVLPLLLLALAAPVRAQVCPDTNYRLYDQTAVNAFASLGCSEVTGYLEIAGYGAGGITSLSGLGALTSVTGGLYIYFNPFLTSLNGLENLTSVGDDLSISDNLALTSIDGLENLTSVGGYLDIQGNAALTSLDGLENLTSVVGSLYIGTNPVLSSLDGLAGLSSTGGRLYITSNAALMSLDGLDSITSVGGLLEISSNAALTSLGALNSITSVGGGLPIYSADAGLFISSNAALTSLDGLGSLSEVGRSLAIYGNPALTSLNALSSITTVDGPLYIQNNAALASLDGLGNLTSVGLEFYIIGNDALTSLDGIASLTAVGRDLNIRYNGTLEACSCGLSGLISAGAFTGVAGSVYIDSNSPSGLCTSPQVVLDTPCAVTASCADGAPLTIDASAFTPDGSHPTFGELVTLQNLGSGDIDLATCSVAAFDPFTEQVTYSSLMEGVITGTSTSGVSSASGGTGFPLYTGAPFPANALPDGPGAIVIVEGELAPGASVADALGTLISGIVYQSTGDVLAVYSDAPGSATSQADFGRALLALLNPTSNEGEAGAIDLAVSAAPNPVRDRTTVSFGVAEAADVRVAVYDALGREVAVLAEAPFAAGRHEVAFEAGALPAGVYLIRASVGPESRITRVTVAR